MRPIGTNLIIKPEEAIKSFGNIVLPEVMWDKVNKGTVVLAGDKSTIAIGANVAYMKQAGVEVEYKDTIHLFLKASEIYAVL